MNPIVDRQAQQIWQSQPLEGMKMSADAIRLRAGKFERRIDRRNLRENIAGVFVIAFFAHSLITTHEILFRVTWGLFIVGMIWILVHLRLKGTPRSMPGDMGASTCLEFFRSELERQRDLVKNVWPWYLAPLVPGYLALNAAFIYHSPHPIRWGTLTLMDAFFVAVFAGVWMLNQRAARCLQRSVDELTAAQDAK